MLIQELAHQASSTQEESSSLDQSFGPSQEGEEDFQEKIFRRLVSSFCKCQDFIFR